MQQSELTRAAMEPFNPGPEIEAALLANDMVQAYRLAPQVARLSVLEQIEAKTKLRAGFGDLFSVRDWDRIIRESAPAEGVPHQADIREPDGPDLLTYPLTDSGNAERLVTLFGHDLRFCVEIKKWLVWDGVRWAVDDMRAAKQLAKRMARSLYVQANDIPDKDFRKAAEAHSRKAEMARGVTATLECAEHEPGIPIRADALDAHPWLFNVQNGTLNLKTGTLNPHRRADLITKLAPVAYDPMAAYPRWAQFLVEVFEPHRDLIQFIQRAVGYSLTAQTREECMFLLHGTGRNGKGVLLRTLAACLGDYAGTADFSAFVQRRDDSGPRDDIANMRGKRLVSAQESREGAALAESLIKWLTGGDLVRARRLYENSSEFDPTWKIWLATNHRPRITGTDTAIWSRIKLIPFDVSFEGRENKHLKIELEAELPGILNWAAEGCLRWQEHGLEFPASVLAATAEYRNESDQIGRFVDEVCIVGPYVSTRARELYGAYRRWAEGAGEDSVSESAFSRRMVERRIDRRRTEAGFRYQGIALRVAAGTGKSAAPVPEPPPEPPTSADLDF